MTAKPKSSPHSPGSFDAFRLARERRVIAGSIDLAASVRLEDRLAEDVGEESIALAWQIEGTADSSGRPALAIALEGAVPVTCQRCLGALAWPVQQRTVALLARNEGEADALDDGSDHEVLVADHLLDPVALVEDELLLTLPYAPVHEAGQCVAVPEAAPDA